MIFDSLEQAADVLTAHFAADLAALGTAKGVAVNSTLRLYKRQTAERFVEFNPALFAAPPVSGLGLYPRRTVTQAKYGGSGSRYSITDLVFDYYCRGPDAVLLEQQKELAAEAILMAVDRLAGSGSGIFGAGAAEGSIRIDFPREPFSEVPEGNYDARVVVVAPVNGEDAVLD